MVQMAPLQGNFTTTNGELPCEGTKALPFNLDFTVADAYLIDLTQQYNQKLFTSIQCVYIDNSLNPSPLQIICGTTNQVTTCPPFSQGFFELLLPTPPKLMVQTIGVLVVNIQLLNFYIPPDVWTIGAFSNTGLPQIDIPALDAIISNGALTVASKPFTIQGVTDASSAIAAGGTPQIVIPANAARERWIVSNPSTATEVLQFSLGSAGAGKIDLLPGMIWDESGSSIVGDAVYLVAPTTGHTFSAYYD